MGFDYECIVDVSKLAGEYFCPVCSQLVYPDEALKTQCSHLFCKPCLTYTVCTSQACPYDGFLVTEADSKPLKESDKALAETIGKIPVTCLYIRSGCPWKGNLSDCSSHCGSCVFGSSPVVCNKCGVQIVHRQVQEHVQNCPGIHSQVQQAATVVSTATVQSQTTNASAATIQAAGGPSSQDVNQQAIATSQVQAVTSQVQAVTSTAPQKQGQYYQQQYQLYYQQYPGYDPYQQQYQLYYAYQQPTIQQFQQHLPDGQGQQPVQVYPHPQQEAQAQAQAQAQIPTQLHQQPQIQPHHPQPQQLLHAHAPPVTGQYQNQAAVNPPQQYLAAGQPPFQMQAPVQAQSHGPYPGKQQRPQQSMPQYHHQQHPLVQHPPAQIQPPFQQQQPLSQPQPQIQPPFQAGSQYVNTAPPFHAVSGHQFYAQPQAHQHMQVAPQQVNPQNALFPHHPPNPHLDQLQHPPALFPHHPPHRPALQPPHSIQSQQTFQGQPSMPVQNQLYPPAPFVQQQMYPPHSLPTAPYQSVTPQNMMQQSQNYNARPTVPNLGVQPQPAAQSPAVSASSGQDRPMQPFMNQAPLNQNDTLRRDNQLVKSEQKIAQSDDVISNSGPSVETKVISNQGTYGLSSDGRFQINRAMDTNKDPKAKGIGTLLPENGSTFPDPSIKSVVAKTVDGVIEPKVNSVAVGTSFGGKTENMVKSEVSRSEFKDGSKTVSQDQDQGHVGGDVKIFPAHNEKQGKAFPNPTNQIPVTEQGRDPSYPFHVSNIVKFEVSRSEFKDGSKAVSQDQDQGRVGGDVKIFPANNEKQGKAFPNPTNQIPVTEQGRDPSYPFHVSNIVKSEVSRSEFKDRSKAVSKDQDQGHVGGDVKIFPAHNEKQGKAFPNPTNQIPVTEQGRDPSYPVHVSNSGQHQRNPGSSLFPLVQSQNNTRPQGSEQMHLKGMQLVPPECFPADPPHGNELSAIAMGKRSHISQPHPNHPARHHDRVFRPPLAPSDVRDRVRPLGSDGNTGRLDPAFLAPTFEFSRHHMDRLAPISPGREYLDFHSHNPHLHRNQSRLDDINGWESHPFNDATRGLNFSSDPIRHKFSQNRFPQRGEVDVPENFRGSDLTRPEMLPPHLREGGSFGSGKFHGHFPLPEPGFGSYGDPRMGDFAGSGNLYHRPLVGESSGENLFGQPRIGETGFSSNYSSAASLDSIERRRPPGIYCRICDVVCESLEALEMHAQTKDHQKMSLNVVANIKRNARKRKATNLSSLEPYKSRRSGYEARRSKN
ncbi:uncharacterized protein LOC124934077 [Impatiens glandulifera]|uniref:uncharacterized protein LOC124934077 n=1 Tax=Impatiens glandulifera TaxID=253017 RepID=UPI001FB19F6E|nr:uncharacterized protein LOC124934077 [Impatiens glandulifera]XP_047330503.1 uncharacterized protein LOC124934077 [Impatiens glandulifera]